MSNDTHSESKPDTKRNVSPRNTSFHPPARAMACHPPLCTAVFFFFAMNSLKNVPGKALFTRVQKYI